jgi:hypothetical protein
MNKQNLTALLNTNISLPLGTLVRDGNVFLKYHLHIISEGFDYVSFSIEQAVEKIITIFNKGCNSLNVVIEAEVHEFSEEPTGEYIMEDSLLVINDSSK